MTKLQIRMRQVDQVKDFVDLLSKYPSLHLSLKKSSASAMQRAV